MTKLPFKIRREDGASLTDQVAAGLRFAIRSGTFHAGDSLPALLKMAAQTGVSTNVVCNAVKRLTREGLVSPHPRTGITVNGSTGQAWRASVLGLQWGAPGIYYQNVLSSVVTERLEAANVLFDATHISYEEPAKGFPKVQAHLAHAFSLAVLEGIVSGLDELLASRGIPFVHFTSSRPSPRAARAILMRHSAVFPVIRDHCLACGAREVLLVGLPPNDEGNTQLGKLLTDAGVRCRAMSVQPIIVLPESPEIVERRALNAMDAWLERERRLPDLIWFRDDFVAQGALTAMANRGIRIPDDVQVITWANTGLGPVYVKPLTRVEMNPVQHGEAIAACVLEQLDGKRSGKKPIVLTPAFIEGATTVKKTHVAKGVKGGANESD
jgi:DNA-binding LacI/PurR family transcriptional regulator